jgi:membrane protease YdiL (CAAX protease family)
LSCSILETCATCNLRNLCNLRNPFSCYNRSVSTSSEQLPAQPASRPWPLAPEAEPVFGLFEVFIAFLSMLVAVVFCGALAIVIAQHTASLGHLRPVELATQTRVLIPAQLVAYLLCLAALWRLFSHHHHIGFFRALSWRWPRQWGPFLIAGVLLAIAVQFASHWLPTPPELPIDKMVRTPLDAWMMAAFGVIVAPFVEEVLFRGLLFPALARRLGVVLSLVATSAVFGAIHAQQLAGAWIQVTLIVLVGVVLTVVRWRYHSLASSTLVHVGYNATLFAALFIETSGFTRFTGH